MARRALLFAAAAMLPAGAPAAVCRADLLLTGGKVITVDGDRIAEAVAVRGNRIVRVGTAAELAACRGARTKVIALAGGVLLPGFIDSHSHVQGMAEVERNTVNIQVPPLDGPPAIIAALKAAQARKAPGAWLIGQGTYNQPMPSRAELDAAFPDNPVDLQWSVHDHLINHRAAVAMGLTRDYPDPPAGTTGRFERTATGEVAIARDATIPLPTITPSFAETKEAVRYILADFYLKRGVTTVSDLSDAQTYRAYRELARDGALPTRVRTNLFLRDPKTAAATLARIAAEPRRPDAGGWILPGAVKLILDGVWGTTAAVYKPFWKGSAASWKPDNVGGVSYDQATLTELVTQAHRDGRQVEIHANGDRAQDMALTAFEAAQRAAPRRDARFRIEHFGNFLVRDAERTEARLGRMRRDGVIPSPQPAFLWRLTAVNAQEPDLDFMALRTLIDRGFRPAGGVDTVGTQNFATIPLFSIARAVERKSRYGVLVQPEQAITPMEAIRMFTIWAAEANFVDAELGSIAVGKLADLVVLGGDPLTAGAGAIAAIPVAMTIIDGKVRYDAAAR